MARAEMSVGRGFTLAVSFAYAIGWACFVWWYQIIYKVFAFGPLLLLTSLDKRLGQVAMFLDTFGASLEQKAGSLNAMLVQMSHQRDHHTSPAVTKVAPSKHHHVDRTEKTAHSYKREFTSSFKSASNSMENAWKACTQSDTPSVASTTAKSTAVPHMVEQEAEVRPTEKEEVLLYDSSSTCTTPAVSAPTSPVFGQKELDLPTVDIKETLAATALLASEYDAAGIIDSHSETSDDDATLAGDSPRMVAADKACSLKPVEMLSDTWTTVTPANTLGTCTPVVDEDSEDQRAAADVALLWQKLASYQIDLVDISLDTTPYIEKSKSTAPSTQSTKQALSMKTTPDSVTVPDYCNGSMSKANVDASVSHPWSADDICGITLPPPCAGDCTDLDDQDAIIEAECGSYEECAYNDNDDDDDDEPIPMATMVDVPLSYGATVDLEDEYDMHGYDIEFEDMPMLDLVADDDDDDDDDDRGEVELGSDVMRGRGHHYIEVPLRIQLGRRLIQRKLAF
ncbi:hypothetical protein THASP1DRAFT_22328 [Thamnocephalis sphaerospora]|uniref:Uncharacterized protein n=1 Tax=Thamnocephalis sphaerospora TaxID=78915 RepID=A0A4P9XWS0_9FUNG|nr:hypothetical protein THASP1DRAFT_22328 [Thamnocephalis sphaerospora]|eukprot:RKP09870.1 hypothetical protein THASP1DRAFT_22328 [Thamnocephalis sphaerospora]